MTWTIDYSETAGKQLAKLDKKTAKDILDYMEERVAILDNPRDTGKALKGKLGEFWRYRLGNYRIIADIQDAKILILVVQIGNRKDVYRQR